MRLHGEKMNAAEIHILDLSSERSSSRQNKQTSLTDLQFWSDKVLLTLCQVEHNHAAALLRWTEGQKQCMKNIRTGVPVMLNKIHSLLIKHVEKQADLCMNLVYLIDGKCGIKEEFNRHEHHSYRPATESMYQKLNNFVNDQKVRETQTKVAQQRYQGQLDKVRERQKMLPEWNHGKYESVVNTITDYQKEAVSAFYKYVQAGRAEKYSRIEFVKNVRRVKCEWKDQQHKRLSLLMKHMKLFVIQLNRDRSIDASTMGLVKAVEAADVSRMVSESSKSLSHTHKFPVNEATIIVIPVPEHSDTMSDSLIHDCFVDRRLRAKDHHTMKTRRPRKSRKEVKLVTPYAYPNWESSDFISPGSTRITNSRNNDDIPESVPNSPCPPRNSSEMASGNTMWHPFTPSLQQFPIIRSPAASVQSLTSIKVEHKSDLCLLDSSNKKRPVKDVHPTVCDSATNTQQKLSIVIPLSPVDPMVKAMKDHRAGRFFDLIRSLGSASVPPGTVRKKLR